MTTEKFFNTAGPVNPAFHYCLPPLQRFDLAEVLRLIAQQRYFVLHAPRQSGKTTSLLALQNYLNEAGNYRALYVNVEGVQTARDDTEAGISAMDTSNAGEGHLLIFDRSPSKSWDEKIFTIERDGITIWGF